MKKIYLSIILLISIAFGIYLNRTYSYIYYKINQVGLKPPGSSQAYLIGNNSKSDKNLSYTALGDSLTAGVGVDNYEQSYPFLVAQKISLSGHNVILNTQSFPGAKTEDLKNKLITAVIQDQPDIITVFVGVNDVYGNVKRTEFEKNYDEILKRLTQETKAKIYLINLPFIGAADLLWPPYNYYFNWRTSRFNQVIKELANTYQIKYLDLYSPTLVEFRKSGSHYSLDLFHPSAIGYASWAQIIYDDFNF